MASIEDDLADTSINVICIYIYIKHPGMMASIVDDLANTAVNEATQSLYTYGCGED